MNNIYNISIRAWLTPRTSAKMAYPHDAAWMGAPAEQYGMAHRNNGLCKTAGTAK